MATSSPLKPLWNPLNLGVLAAGTAAAVGLHSIPLAAIGGLAYAALVAWDAMGAASAPAPAPVDPLPDPDAIPDPECRRALEAIRRARAERERALSSAPDSVVTHLAQALASVGELEANAGALAARAIGLHAWLAHEDRRAVEVEAARLEGLAREARDPDARAQYEGAHAAQLERLRAVDDVQQARERILSNLERIGATLGALPPKLVHMRALDDEAMDTVGADVSRDLSTLTQDVRLFERTLQSLKQRTPT